MNKGRRHLKLLYIYTIINKRNWSLKIFQLGCIGLCSKFTLNTPNVVPGARIGPQHLLLVPGVIGDIVRGTLAAS